VASDDLSIPKEEFMSVESLLRTTQTDGRLELAAAGAWTSESAGEIERLVDEILRQKPRIASIDLGNVRELDTFGAWLVERLVRGGRDKADVRLVGVADRFSGLLSKVRQLNRRPSAPTAPVRGLLNGLSALADRLLRVGLALGSGLEMFGALAVALSRVAVRPRTLRFTSFVHHLDRVGWQAVPIIVLITFLIGCIISQQAIFHFRSYGAEDYVVDLVGILVLREIGVLIVSIMVAGRSGSSYTAELGSMKMREEIDALRTMGRDPVEILMLPRVLALVCALPMLTLIGSLAALAGGGLVAWLYGGIAPEIFISRFREAVSATHFEVGAIKAPFMALVIGTVACSEGLQVKGSAESLGLQTTTSVVKSIFMVIVLDGIFAMFFALIGM
jgi:phospholipid/cholesterol/gamma-HCH transport system permease protein